MKLVSQSLVGRGLCLTVTSKSTETRLKNVKRWHAKKYANKVGIIHESKGQHIGKAPSLHRFHTTADAMLLDHIGFMHS